jgi:mannose-1-phosphate guanylyltransferase
VKAFLLAAGLGTRLRPITETTPKCLVDIAGRPLLDIWLDALAAAGVEEVLLNTHHLARSVEGHVTLRVRSPEVRLSHEPVLMGSAGTLLANREFVTDEDMFLVINADNLTDFDLRGLIDVHRSGAVIATLSVFRAPRPSECGIVELADGRVVGFHEKPEFPASNLANAGMYAFHPSVLDEIPEPLPRDIGFDLLPRLVGRAGAVNIGGCYFRDIGNLAALESAREEWKGRKAS